MLNETEQREMIAVCKRLTSELKRVNRELEIANGIIRVLQEIKETRDDRATQSQIPERDRPRE